MTSATRRADSDRYQIQHRLPSDVVAKAKGRSILLDLPAMGRDPAVTIKTQIRPVIKVSLRTNDRDVGKARVAAALAQINQVVDSVRNGPIALPLPQIVALSGEVYRLYWETYRGDPKDPNHWAAIKGLSRAVREGRVADAPTLDPHVSNDVQVAKDYFGIDLTTGINSRAPGVAADDAMEQRFGLLANWVLSRRGLTIDAPTRKRLLIEVDRAATDAAWRLKRAADGDYTPDPRAARFPSWDAEQAGITLTQLFEKWRLETNPAASTVTTWRAFVRSLASHVKHEDATKITDVDVIGWKDSLVSSGISPNTINRTHLSGLRAVFAFGLRNKLVSINPAIGVKVAFRRQAGTKKLPYTDAEVARLLTLARSEKKQPYRRWLPLLAACTGARIGELAQLWGGMVRTDGDQWVMDIKPADDAGSLKNEISERTIPLHHALIAEGFLSYVKAKGAGPLFYRRSSGDTAKRHASKGVTNHLASWVRENGFVDPRKAPSHALRHWFKSACVKADVPEGVADAIQGHAGRSEADTYRHYDTATLARHLAGVIIPGAL